MVCVFNEAVLQTEIIYLKGIISQVCMKQPVDQHQGKVNKNKESKPFECFPSEKANPLPSSRGIVDCFH